MQLSPLTAISPVDGRYHKSTQVLSSYFSEFALIRFRVHVEIEYFIALCESDIPQLPQLSAELKSNLQKLVIDFNEKDAEHIKDIEKTTNHDVKAVEYFIKEKFDLLGLQDLKEFIHFGLTSQDINNTAIPFSWKKALTEVYFPELISVVDKLKDLAGDWKNIAMLARTHGQPASPTRLGKEILVFCERLENQLAHVKQIPFSAKFGGATGNFNAHHLAYPQINWVEFGNKFVDNQLGLSRSQYTTQIEHYDNFAAHCDGLKRINNILIDLSRDVWTYISTDYFKQQIVAGQIGSSAMPHKVNPID